MPRIDWPKDRETHYSDLSGYLWCQRKFMFNKATGVVEDDEGQSLYEQDFRNVKLVAGIAMHKAIEFYEQLAGEELTESLANKFVGEAWNHAVNERPEPIFIPDSKEGMKMTPSDYYMANRERFINMLFGYVDNIPEDMGPVIASEIRFNMEINEQLYGGTIDQLREYRGGIAIVDFKSGASATPQPFLLRYGLQFSTYARALKYGWFKIGEVWSHKEQKVIQEGTPFKIDPQMPTKLFWVNLYDFTPYARKTWRDPYGADTHPEVKAWLEASPWERNVKNGKIKVPDGEFRGPGWYATDRDESDIPRFEMDARRIVQGIKMQIFPRNLSKQTCSKCDFQSTCLQEVTGEADKLTEIASELKKRGEV